MIGEPGCDILGVNPLIPFLRRLAGLPLLAHDDSFDEVSSEYPTPYFLCHRHLDEFSYFLSSDIRMKLEVARGLQSSKYLPFQVQKSPS